MQPHLKKRKKWKWRYSSSSGQHQQHFTEVCEQTHPDTKGLDPSFTLCGCEASLSVSGPSDIPQVCAPGCQTCSDSGDKISGAVPGHWND